jgi:hypothetical protein
MGGFNAAPRDFRGDISANELNLQSLSADPPSPETGDIWYRTDIDVFRLQTNSGVQSLTTTERTDTTPDSVIHQYKAANFSSGGWVDSVNNADMSVNGPTKTTLGSAAAVDADGGTDFAVASGPETVPSNPQFSVALTFQSSDLTDSSFIFGSGFNPSSFRLVDKNQRDNSLGEINFVVIDQNRDGIEIETNNVFVDGNTHLLVINADTTLGASGVDFYIDDMLTPVATTTFRDEGFDNQSYNPSADMTFFTDDANEASRTKALKAGLFEFNTDLYSQTERELLKARRPEV